jgi:hypothetical protein
MKWADLATTQFNIAEVIAFLAVIAYFIQSCCHAANSRLRELCLYLYESGDGRGLGRLLPGRPLGPIVGTAHRARNDAAAVPRHHNHGALAGQRAAVADEHDPPHSGTTNSLRVRAIVKASAGCAEMAEATAIAVGSGTPVANLGSIACPHRCEQ